MSISGARLINPVRDFAASVRVEPVESRPSTSPGRTVFKGLAIDGRFIERRPARYLGFTLLELMLVLFVLAIAAMVAVPNMQPAIARAQMKSATQDVASALRHTRNEAIGKGREEKFMLNVNNNFYTVPGRQSPYFLPKSVNLSLFTADFLMSEGQGSIVFYPDGSSSGGRVTLKSAGKTRLVDVIWLTGNVEIRNPDDD